MSRQRTTEIPLTCVNLAEGEDICYITNRWYTSWYMLYKDPLTVWTATALGLQEHRACLKQGMNVTENLHLFRAARAERVRRHISTAPIYYTLRPMLHNLTPLATAFFLGQDVPHWATSSARWRWVFWSSCLDSLTASLVKRILGINFDSTLTHPSCVWDGRGFSGIEKQGFGYRSVRGCGVEVRLSQDLQKN